MAEKIRKLSNSEIEVLAKIVGECMTGTQMDSIFHECGVRAVSYTHLDVYKRQERIQIFRFDYNIFSFTSMWNY